MYIHWMLAPFEKSKCRYAARQPRTFTVQMLEMVRGVAVLRLHF